MKSTMRCRPAAVLLALSPFVLAACSASNDAAFVRKANAVCADRAAAVRALPFPSTGGDLLVLGVRVNALEEREQHRLARIEAPGDERSALTAFIRSIDRVQRANAIFRDAFIRSNATDLARARTGLGSARSSSNRAAQRLGLSCRH